MQNFNELNLPQPLMQALERMQYSTPTPIQAQAIPLALAGKDLLGSAQTGTGKTAAFGIPLVAKLMNNPRGSALVLTPTRELADQVIEIMNQLLGKYSTIRSALLIGGESMPKQIQALRGRPRLIVGTPGRVIDHLERGTLMLHDTNFLVLDETDRMLDMGFGIQLDKIMKFLKAPQRQTLLFSATLPDNIVKIANKYLTNPVRISVGSTTKAMDTIQQEIIRTTDGEKYAQLLKLLNERQGSIIVFVKTKFGADKLADKLNRLKHNSDAIHGDLRQSKRDRVIDNFRERKIRILVATDIAARGLDIPHIEHVVNYDLPQCPEDYIHRIGRTGRAGAEGAAVSLITPTDHDKWKAIHKLMNPGEKLEGDFPSSNPPRKGGGKRPFRNKNHNRQGHGQPGQPQGQGQRRRHRDGQPRAKAA